jgi:[ribosomal protein S5]-alanine N-acetyltransferase
MDKGTDLPLLIRLTASGEFLGMATLQNVDTVEPRLGIWLKEGAHGNGFGSEAGHAVLAWAARVRGAEFLRYPVVAGDIPSKRLAERLGGKKGDSRIHRKSTGVELKILDYRIATGLPIPPPRGR